MRAFFRQFKEFAVKGNVVDLAIAVVIGGAFGKIVTALVETIITPAIGLLLGGINVADRAFTIGDATIAYGRFVQSVIDFVIIAFVIFLVVRGMNTFKKKEEERPAEPTEEVKLLREIRDELKQR